MVSKVRTSWNPASCEPTGSAGAQVLRGGERRVGRRHSGNSCRALDPDPLNLLNMRVLLYYCEGSMAVQWKLVFWANEEV